MPRASRTTHLLKWLGTLLCLLIGFASAYSARMAVVWMSPSLDQAELARGRIGYGWLRDDAPLDDWKYAPSPGWSHVQLGGPARLDWWIDVGENRYWRWGSVPLWMPFVIFAIPTVILWYRDRRTTFEALRRFFAWMTPRRLKKITVWQVARFCVLHVVVVFCSFFVLPQVYDFFMQPRSDDVVGRIIEPLFLLLFWTTPLWAVLWAWLWNKYANWLFKRQPHPFCHSCGYNLTGNTSGRCPECGSSIDAPVPREAAHASTPSTSPGRTSIPSARCAGGARVSAPSAGIRGRGRRGS